MNLASTEVDVNFKQKVHSIERASEGQKIEKRTEGMINTLKIST